MNSAASTEKAEFSVAFNLCVAAAQSLIVQVISLLHLMR
jgi:hypothetical protein